MQMMFPAIFDQLLTFVTYACQAPSYGQIETKVMSKAASKQVSDANTVQYGVENVSVFNEWKASQMWAQISCVNK